ncbi:MAG: outer membrane beta-barrel protein, partial [Bacteroidota bacterium]
PLNMVNQLYAYWNVTDKFTLTLGNFNTFLGYEVISPAANFNYSTSYMFSYGPFSHSGLKADIDLGGGFTAMAAMLNATDFTDFNPANEFYGGLQVGYSNDVGGIWLNGLFTDGFWQADITTGWDVTDLLYLGLNSTVASDNFTGVAGYAQVAATDNLAIGFRGEYFLDQGVGVLNQDESVVDLTLSANYSIAGLTFIPELRIDLYSEEDFVVTDALTDSRANSLSSFVLAAVYAF